MERPPSVFTLFLLYTTAKLRSRDARGSAPGPRSGRCPDNPPGALPLDPAKGLRPSRHPGGCTAMGRFPCGGHGARRARRDAGIEACRCCGGEGSASADAGRGLCDRPLHSFAAPYRLLRKGARRNITSCINHTLHPKGAKVSKGRPQSPLVAAAAASRRLRVAARLSRAVTPAREKTKFQPTRMGVERAEGPSQESRGQRPLVGFQRAKPFGGVQGQSTWQCPFE